MESNNTFEGGMVSDVSKLIQAKNMYLQAVNFRPQSELGQSNGSLVSIKGNNCEISFPTLQATYKFKLTSSTIFATSTFTFLINGQTSGNATVNKSATTEAVYNVIKAMPNCYQTTNGSPVTPTFAVAYNTDYIFIYQTPVYNGCGADSTPLTIRITATSFSAGNYFSWLDFSGIILNNPSLPPFYILPIPTNLVVIGSTFINEYFYIYTCPPTNTYGTGQIWEMWYESDEDIDTFIEYLNELEVQGLCRVGCEDEDNS